MFGLSIKLCYISLSCFFKRSYIKRAIVATKTHFWGLAFPLYSLWRKSASLSELSYGFIWGSRKGWSVNITTVDSALVKSKSHAASASSVSLMCWNYTVCGWNPREALHAQRSRVRLSHLELAFAFLLYLMASVVCCHTSNFSFDLLSRGRKCQICVPFTVSLN